jgi:tripartite-type tricarboxylate transporter receptor subunit TctC
MTAKRHGTLAFLVLGAAMMLAAPGSAPAQQPYPAKPVKIVVAFAPGGGTDFIARFIAQRLSATTGQPFIVENKPGAGGSIGFEAGVKSLPDGYTLTLISSSYTVNPSLYKLSYDPAVDIAPIIQISQGPLLVVVHPSLPVKSIGELIALAKAKPGELNFASAGAGSNMHLATELFVSMAGIRMTHIPYKGTGPALTATLAGQTKLMFATASSALPHARSGRLRPIAVTTRTRLPAEPDIPTVAESGLPGYEVVLWHGLIGPKGVPRPIVERLNREVSALLNLKETGEQLQNDGVFPAGGAPEQFRATISREIEMWRKVVAHAGVNIE